MWLRGVVSLGAYQIALIGLAQVDVMSDSIFRILEQYPPLFIVLIVVYYLQKSQRDDNRERRNQQKEDNAETRAWLDKMLTTQRENMKEVCDGQQQFIQSLIMQIESKQNSMSERIELLTQQMAINTSTVSEIAKVDSMVSELIARLEKK